MAKKKFTIWMGAKELVNCYTEEYCKANCIPMVEPSDTFRSSLKLIKEAVKDFGGIRTIVKRCIPRSRDITDGVLNWYAKLMAKLAMVDLALKLQKEKS